MTHEEECGCDTCLTATLRAENERLRRRVKSLEVQLVNESSKVLKWEIKCADEGKRVAGEIAEFVKNHFKGSWELANDISRKYGL